jgi:hypothetical protein
VSSFQLPVVKEPQVVREWEDGNRWIRATINLYRGKVLLDIRQWWEPEPGKPLKPGKGISLLADSIDELEAAVAAFKKALATPASRQSQDPSQLAQP